MSVRVLRWIKYRLSIRIVSQPPCSIRAIPLALPPVSEDFSYIEKPTRLKRQVEFQYGPVLNVNKPPTAKDARKIE